MNNTNPITNNADVNYSTKKLVHVKPKKLKKQFEPGTYIEHISQKIEKFFLRRVLLWQKTCKRKSGKNDRECFSERHKSACEHG